MFDKHYINIDIDNMLKAGQVKHVLKILKLEAWERVSSSGRGKHFKIKCRSHTQDEDLIIRFMFGDCFGRIAGDYRRLVNGSSSFSLLFDCKNGKRCSKWKKI